MYNLIVEEVIEMIERKYYYDQIVSFMDKPMIKILTGIRRSGKSTLMKLIQNKLIENGVPPEHIIYINFESMKYIELRTAQKFYDYVVGLIKKETRMYLFFDEIQIVDRWEEAVNSFLVDLNVDIYITGSNSDLFSSELSTLLTGRYVQFRLQTLSYSEVIDFHAALGENEDKNRLLWQFIRRGGFPAVHIANYDESTCYRIISDIYDSVVLRDIVQRFNIRNVELLNRIVTYIMDNVGKTFSAKSISDYFKSQQRKVDLNTIYNYIEALESSFVISKVSRYDVHGKEILKTLEKFYLADHGIQHAIFGYRDRNISGVLENIVYNELIMRGYRVYIGKLHDLEIDFIAERQNEKIYVQVAYQMSSEKTVSREFTPLLMVKDHYPKYVVSMDENFKDNIEGVKHVYLGDFILGLDM